jgi:hypothetical protein
VIMTRHLSAILPYLRSKAFDFPCSFDGSTSD